MKTSDNWESIRKTKTHITLRLLIYVRDNFTCAYCGEKCTFDDNSPHGITLDHINPRAKNGSHNRFNLVVAHRSCNGSKKDQPIDQFLSTIERHKMIIDLRVNKPLDRKLENKLQNMPIKQARMHVYSMA